MSVNEELRDLVSASSAQVLNAINRAPDDEAFTTTQDPAAKTAADYALLVAQDKADLATGLGSQTVPAFPPAFTTKAQANSVIRGVEQSLEDQIIRLAPDDFGKPPPTLGYPIDCELPTYYDCVVAHSHRDTERADAITAIFGD
jgi:hypothetical protein